MTCEVNVITKDWENLFRAVTGEIELTLGTYRHTIISEGLADIKFKRNTQKHATLWFRVLKSLYDKKTEHIPDGSIIVISDCNEWGRITFRARMRHIFCWKETYIGEGRLYLQAKIMFGYCEDKDRKPDHQNILLREG